MSTSLLVVDNRTVDYKYRFALSIFLFDMECIERGTAEDTNFSPYVMNMYINDAIALMH